jgi:bacillithiol system protein YtxJ
MAMQELTAIQDLDAASAANGANPFFLFKHSTRCSISAAAYGRVTGYLDNAGAEHVPFYLIKVIESRPVSKEIERRYRITHESPQLILIKNGQAVWSASHSSITAKAITAALDAS